MDQPPDLLPFLDRRNESQKGKPVTEQPKKKREPKSKKAVLRLILEYEHRGDIVAVAREVIAKAKEGNAVVRAAKLTGLPSSTDLA